MDIVNLFGNICIKLFLSQGFVIKIDLYIFFVCMKYFCNDMYQYVILKYI